MCSSFENHKSRSAFFLCFPSYYLLVIPLTTLCRNWVVIFIIASNAFHPGLWSMLQITVGSYRIRTSIRKLQRFLDTLKPNWSKLGSYVCMASIPRTLIYSYTHTFMGISDSRDLADHRKHKISKANFRQLQNFQRKSGCQHAVTGKFVRHHTVCLTERLSQIRWTGTQRSLKIGNSGPRSAMSNSREWGLPQNVTCLSTKLNISDRIQFLIPWFSDAPVSFCCCCCGQIYI